MQDEIKKIIWDCGGYKAPDPNGFNFSFVKHLWDLMKENIMDLMIDFVTSGFILPICNSSFITFIPKFVDPWVVKDFTRLA